MKICMVTTSKIFHDTRILNEAESLAKVHDVIVLARKYPQQKKNGFSFKIKLINYYKIPFYQLNIFSSLFFLMKAVMKEKADVLHAHDLDGLLCAFPAALLCRKTLIYDSHEIWTDTYPFENLKGIQWFFPILERMLMWKVQAGITVNKSIAKVLTKKYHKKFISIYNIANNNIETIPKKSNFFHKYLNKKIVIHVGGANEGRGFEEMIESLAKLPKNIIFIFLGADLAKSDIKTNVKYLRLKDQIEILSAIYPQDIIPIISKADLSLALTQKKSKSYYYSLPNKIFQYIAAEVPILGSNFPEFRNIIQKYSIGEVVNPSNPKLIAQKIIYMLKKTPQKRYRHNLVGLAEEKYNWTIEARKLHKIYMDLK